MISEAFQRARAGKRFLTRSGALWFGSSMMGILAFAFAWGLDYGLNRLRIDTLEQLKNIVYDRGANQFAHENQERRKAPGEVVIVAIRDRTAELLKDIPSFVPGISGTLSYARHARAFHARLLQNLTRLGAKVVGIDIVFDADRRDLDPYFARAIRENGHVILGAVDNTGLENSGLAETTTSILQPNPTLSAAAAGIGFVNIPLDSDKTARRFQWYYQGIDSDTAEDTRFPALGVAVAALAMGADPKQVIRNEVLPRRTFLHRPLHEMGSGENISSMMRFYGQAGIPSGTGSLLDYENVVLRGQDPAAFERLRSTVQGRVVIVGDETQLGHDVHRVPVVSRTQLLGEPNLMAGPEIQAHIAQSAIQGRFAYYAPGWSPILLALVVCLLVTLLGRRIQPVPLCVISLLLLAGLYLSTVANVASSGLFLQPVTASVGVITAVILEASFMHFAERKDRMAVRRQLSRHVGPGVADKLADDEWPEFGGESREITLLFSDLQGFTTISESLTSQEICAVLNRYFGVVFPILDQHGGSVDKLMGDGLMAYFGFPKRQPDHAARAIRCAIDIQQALEVWQHQPENVDLPTLHTRIGIHTGLATVGEIGSGERAEFTVIGDIVNVASRLEGMNKDFGTTILISETTRGGSGEIVPMAYRGVATVRGRKEPTAVYSIEPTANSTGRRQTVSHSSAPRTADLRETEALKAEGNPSSQRDDSRAF